MLCSGDLLDQVLESLPTAPAAATTSSVQLPATMDAIPAADAHHVATMSSLLTYHSERPITGLRSGMNLGGRPGDLADLLFGAVPPVTGLFPAPTAPPAMQLPTPARDHGAPTAGHFPPSRGPANLAHPTPTPSTLAASSVSPTTDGQFDDFADYDDDSPMEGRPSTLPA